MATTSFTKNIVIEDPDEVRRFFDVFCDEAPRMPVDTELASDKELERGRELLVQYLSR